MLRKHSWRWLWLGLLLGLCGGPPLASHAQDSLPLDENILGSTSLQQAGMLYSFSAQHSSPHLLSVRALSPQFAPRLALYDATGQRLHYQANPSGAAQQQLLFTPNAGSTYSIQVVGSLPGQFVLNLRLVEEASPPTEVHSTDSLRGRVSEEAPLQHYRIPVQGEALRLHYLSDEARGGAALSLYDQHGAMIAALSARGRSLSVILTPGEASVYQLYIQHSGAARTESYQLSLLPLDFRASAGSADLPLATDCQLWTDNQGGVTVRAEPGAGFSSVGYLLPPDLYPVTARSPNWDWWQIELDADRRGWVRDGQVIREGDCADVVTLGDSD